MKNLRTKISVQQAIPTSSLPDIIFILLFFFMVVTVMKPDLLIERTLPEAKQLKKLQPDSKNLHVYLGRAILNGQQVIQLDGKLLRVEDLEGVLNQRLAPGTSQNKLVVLEIDKDMSMKSVLQVQQVLRRRGLRKVMYLTKTPIQTL